MKALVLFSSFVALVGCSTTSTTPSPEAGADGDVPKDASTGDRVATPQDAAACEPQAVPGFKPPDFVPPVPAQNVCAAAQIQAFWDKCVGDQGSVQACQLWNVSNKACAACLSTGDSAPAWGALVYATDGYHPNAAGCIATLGFLDCAKSSDALWACTSASCRANCPPDDDGGTAGYDACRTAASASVCSMYESSAKNVCPMDSATTSLCLQGPLQKFYMAFAPILCSSGG